MVLEMLLSTAFTNQLAPSLLIASPSDRLPVPSDAKDVLSLLHFMLQDTSVDNIVLGDFSLHHSTWGRQHNRPDSESKHLIPMYNAQSLRPLLVPSPEGRTIVKLQLI